MGCTLTQVQLGDDVFLQPGSGDRIGTGTTSMSHLTIHVPIKRASTLQAKEHV